MDTDNTNKKEVSDLTADTFLKGEGSGMEKFDHRKGNMMEALNISQEDFHRFRGVVSSLQSPQSKAIEDILLSDKLHTTKERVVASMMFGRMISDLASAGIVARLMDKLL